MLKDICRRLGFDEGVTVYLTEAYEKIRCCDAAVKAHKAAEELIFSGGQGFETLLEEAAVHSGVNRYTSDMVFWLCCGIKLYDVYKQHGYPEGLCTESLCDLKYKCDECLNMYGVAGTFTTWFGDFYTLKRFKFGRLEYDVLDWAEGEYKGFLKNGDLVFGCHIPSCGPLSPESVIDSLKQLYEFFKDRLKDGILAVRCCSWLLYPPVAEICREGSNMRRFYELFDIIDCDDRVGNYGDLWRAFYKGYQGYESLKELPEDTGFRRAFKSYLIGGGHIGTGTGIILFDGERVLEK